MHARITRGDFLKRVCLCAAFLPAAGCNDKTSRTERKKANREKALASLEKARDHISDALVITDTDPLDKSFKIRDMLTLNAQLRLWNLQYYAADLLYEHRNTWASTSLRAFP